MNISLLPLMLAVLFSTRQVTVTATTATANGFPRDVVEAEDLHFDIKSSKPQIRHYGKIHAGTVMAKATKFQSHSDGDAQENENNIQKRLVAYDLDPILPPYDHDVVYGQLMIQLQAEEKLHDGNENDSDSDSDSNSAIIEDIGEDSPRESSVEGDQIDTSSSGNQETDIDQRETISADNTEDSIDEVEDPKILTDIQVGNEFLEVEANEAINTKITKLATNSIKDQDDSEGDTAPDIEERLSNEPNELGEYARTGDKEVIESLELHPNDTLDSKATDRIHNKESNTIEQTEQTGEKRIDQESPEDTMEERTDALFESSDESVIIDGDTIDVEEQEEYVAKEEYVATVDTVMEDDVGSNEIIDISVAEDKPMDQNEDEVESIDDPATIIPELDRNDFEDPSSLVFDETESPKYIVEQTPVGADKEEHIIVAKQEKVANENTVYLGEGDAAEGLTIQNSDADSIVSIEDHQEAEGVNDKTPTDVQADEVETAGDSADSNDGDRIEFLQDQRDANIVNVEEGSEEVTTSTDTAQSEGKSADTDAKQATVDNRIATKTDESLPTIEVEQAVLAEIPDGQEYSTDNVNDDATMSEENNVEISSSAADTVKDEAVNKAIAEEGFDMTDQVEGSEGVENTAAELGDHADDNANDKDVDKVDPAILEESNAIISETATDTEDEEPTNEALSENVFETLESLDSETETVEMSENTQIVTDASIDTNLEDFVTIEEAGAINDEELIEKEPQQFQAISKPTANDEFVRGLDDLHKFLEEVDPPDELDVGASGLSLEDVFKQQGVTIIKIRVEKGVAQIKKSLKTLKKNSQKQWNNFKESLDDNFDINVDEMAVSVVEKLEGPYQNVKKFFSENKGKLDGVMKTVDKIVSKAKTMLSRIGIFDSDDDYDYSDEDDDLQINDSDLAEMRKKLMERYS